MPRAKTPQSNRTDLPGKVPTQTAPGQTYGKQTAQAQSQKILPVAAPPQTPAPAGGPAAPVAPAGGGGSPAPLPGKLPWLEPTTHGLPATHGLPYGAGAGPEALSGPAAQWHAQQVSENGTLQQLLGTLAARPGASSAVKAMAANAGAR